MKRNFTFAILAVLTLGLITLSACGDDAGGNTGNNGTIVVGATAVPHSEILEQVAPILAEQGYTLTIVPFDDFILPNLALDAGDLDANFFQHVPYLTSFNAQHGLTLVPVFGVHFEPLQVYAGREDSLASIPQGASIAIPNDPTNEARALLLLESLGLIELTAGLGLTATANDLASNPHDLNIIPMAAEMLPPALPDVDFAVINGNFALAGGVTDRAIYGSGESVDSEAAIQFTNYVVVRAGDENLSAVQALINAINTDTIRDFINNRYEGRVVPQF
ncbi:MAG: MetQ/NlpA family ABC transporter substrate-binding protein [Defluviitaleaceae bacterium]|nr:MetQ/NlpA family ABC transporter substrate-binding protein [Defluviitaleaceae bacterium]